MSNENGGFIMENKTIKSGQMEALIRLYNSRYYEYTVLTDLSEELLKSGEKAASKVVLQRASCKGYFLSGIVASAETLGINPDTFRQAIKEAREFASQPLRVVHIETVAQS